MPGTYGPETWLTNRDIAAAHASWRRACQVADRLENAPDRTAMRIAPRTLLTGSAWRRCGGADTGFDELRELCEAAGDKRSLAVGMSGFVMEHFTNARYREASRLASEHTQAAEAIDDPELTVGLSFAALAAKLQCSENEEDLDWRSAWWVQCRRRRFARRVLIVGSPLSIALIMHGPARWWSGVPAGKDDVRQAIAMARTAGGMMLAGLRSVMPALPFCRRYVATLCASVSVIRYCRLSTSSSQGRRPGPEISTVPSNFPGPM